MKTVPTQPLSKEAFDDAQSDMDSMMVDGSADSNFKNYGDYVSTHNQMYGQHAIQANTDFIKTLGTVGTKPLVDAQRKDSERSNMERLLGGSLLSSDGNPDGPGFAYFNHLYRRMGGNDKIKGAKKEEMMKGSNIYTEATEALKVAIKALGVASSFNPSGLPVDIRDAQKIWFGEEEEQDETKISQWRTSTELGDAAIDPKKVRKFTNYDGSMTWEILNDDKTVSSRFTLGEYAGTKIFSQGGYNKFTEMLEKVKQQVGYDSNTGFDATRKKYGF
jgi:hypothetical protein